MLKEMLISKFETYLLEEDVEHDGGQENVLEEQEQPEYPPGFFSSL